MNIVRIPMFNSFWVLGNSKYPAGVSHVCSADTKKTRHNPFLPSYMQPTEHIPVVLSFTDRQLATRLVANRLHVMPIHQNNLNRSERPFITYATNHHPPDDAMYDLYPVMLSANSTFLSKLVVMSCSQFFVVESFHESLNMITLEGELIDPMSQLTLDTQLDVQHMMFDILEEMYLD
jgi:hypothetical protein